MKQRVNIVTAVNAANVSKDGDKYTVKDVVHAIDGIVLNQRLYTGDELVKAVNGLNGRPAPAGHPKDSKGRHISASNGEALSAAWIGAYCVNSRYEGGRAMCDIVINATQANAMPIGKTVIERLDAAIEGTNTEPIGVSSGLMLEEVAANGESRGKKYRCVATNMAFDHLAILINETPAGTPEEGIGMFVNQAGQESEVEIVNLETAPEDQRSTGLLAWVKRLVGNGSTDLSFDAIQSGLYALMPEGAWIRDVFDRYCIWTDRDNNHFKQDYTVSSDGSVTFSNEPVAVRREVDYVPITNSNEVDPVKDKILAALNAAGISTEGLDETQLLTAYNSLVVKPVNDKLTAANSAIAGFEAAALTAQNAERDALAVKLATNSSLTADDFKAMPLARLKELDAKAAPVVVGNTSAKPGDEFASYSMNSHLEAK